MIALNLKKKLRIFKCACGNEIQTYNIHRKRCDECRAEIERQQMAEGQKRHNAKRAKLKEGELPVDPEREARVINLMKAYEVKDSQLIRAGLKPNSCNAYKALEVLGKI